MKFAGSIKTVAAKLWVSVMVMVVLAVVVGCVKKVGVSDEAEREHPDMKKARVLEEAGDSKGARNIYETILSRDPNMARAHLALAFLMDKPGEDYLAAIYHFRSYLALRPDTEKKAMIEGHIRTATLAFVGTVFTNQSAILERMAKVEGENRALQIRAANLEAQTVQLRVALAVARAKYGVIEETASKSVDTIALPAAVPKSLGKTVKVEKLDTLKKMAGRYYGDPGRWREIYEANKKKMKSPGDLRVGQMIYIPEKDKGAIPE